MNGTLFSLPLQCTLSIQSQAKEEKPIKADCLRQRKQMMLLPQRLEKLSVDLIGRHM